MTINRTGLITALSCYIIWGLLPLYWDLLQHVSAFNVLAHRIIWSGLFMSIVAIAMNPGQFKIDCQQLRESTSQKLLLLIAATLISMNWGIYIWAIATHHVMDTSFGYYINPLLNVLLGILIFKETLTNIQKISVLIAGLGIAYLTYQLGHIPLIALGLALSFGLYGVVKKKLLIHPFTSIAFEAWLATPLALAYTIFVDTTSWQYFTFDAMTTSLFILSGLTTSVPLVLFSYGARLLPLNLLGFLQYVSPTIALCLAIFYFGESFDTNKIIAFSFIWVALVLYTVSNYVGSSHQQN